MRLFLGGALQLFADSRQTQTALGQDLRGKALFLAKEAKQKMFRPDVFVAETLGLFGCVREHTLALVGEREVDRGRDLLADRGVLLNLFADGFYGCVRAQKPVGQRFVLTQKS